MKRLAICIDIMIVLVILTGCKNSKSTDSIQDNGLNFAQNSSTVCNTETTKADEQQKHPLRNMKIYNSNVYDINEPMNIDDIEYSNFKVTVSKNIINGLSKNEIIYNGESSDNDGKLLQKMSYMFVELTIANKTSSQAILYLSGGSFVVLDSENNISDSSVDLRYRSDYTSTDPYKKDYYKYILEGGEKHTVKLVYIVNDELINSNNLYYMINKGGYGPGYDSFKAFKIDSLKGE